MSQVDDDTLEAIADWYTKSESEFSKKLKPILLHETSCTDPTHEHGSIKVYYPEKEDTNVTSD
jgi:hypothetical protein